MLWWCPEAPGDTAITGNCEGRAAAWPCVGAHLQIFWIAVWMPVLLNSYIIVYIIVLLW